MNNKGVAALILVIMITALTLVSSVIMALINTSDVVANYQTSEAETVIVDMDACVDDALWRLGHYGDSKGDFIFNVGNTYCHYDISTAVDHIKTVTSTASTTSDMGSWYKTIVFTVNVSSSPVMIKSYHEVTYYDSLSSQATTCGDWVCNGSETCSTCEMDCGACGYCGDAVCNNSENLCTCLHDGCAAACGDGCCNGSENCLTCGDDCVSCGDGCCAGGENCTICPDDCGACGEACGNGVVEGDEACDYTGDSCDPLFNCSHDDPVGCSGEKYCKPDCSGCTNTCTDCILE